MAKSLFEAQETKLTETHDATVERFDVKGAKDEIWNIVGGGREQDAETMRLLALTNPTRYTSLKNMAIAQVKENVQANYMTAYEQASLANLSVDECKAAGKKSAMTAKETGFKSIQLRFPAADDVVAKGGIVRSNNKLF
jgi:hypothetical protein